VERGWEGILRVLVVEYALELDIRRMELEFASEAFAHLDLELLL